MNELQSSCAVELPAGDGKWVKIMPAGKSIARDGRRFDAGDRRRMQQIVDATRRRLGSDEMVIDYDHQSIYSAVEGVGGTAIAAGWVKELAVRDDGIWARVTWTDAAVKAIKAGEYRYLSPYFYHSKIGEVSRIINAGLTNSPALEGLAAAASTEWSNMKDKLDPETTKKVAELLGLDASASADQVLERLEALKPIMAELGVTATTAASVDPSKFVPFEVFQEAVAESNRLKQGITEEAAERHVSDHIKSGHVAPFMKDWAVALCTVNKPAFDAFVGKIGAATTAIVRQQFDPSVRTTAARSELTVGESAICRALGLTEDEYNEAKPAAAKEVA